MRNQETCARGVFSIFRLSFLVLVVNPSVDSPHPPQIPLLLLVQHRGVFTNRVLSYQVLIPPCTSADSKHRPSPTREAASVSPRIQSLTRATPVSSANQCFSAGYGQKLNPPSKRVLPPALLQQVVSAWASALDDSEVWLPRFLEKMHLLSLGEL